MNRRTFFWSLPLSAAAMSAHSAADAAPLYRFGVIADCQFADIPDHEDWNRRFRLSPNKLREAVADLNTRDLEFVVNLGDSIDQNLASFDVVLPIFAQLKAPVRHALGNHDYDVADGQRAEVKAKLGLDQGHYSWRRLGWRFVMLNGCAVSLFGHEDGTPERAAAMKVFDEAQGALERWNGGLGEAQRRWLAEELAAARAANERVLIFCHWPVFPADKHNLWDTEAVLKIVRDHHDVVAAWMNGHNHAGNYGETDGIHFVNFKGMVDTRENCWAEVSVFPDRLVIDGFHREPDRVLSRRAV
ncbi:MAG: metallophosphoesterase [Verrucomicrobiales bacterium]